MEPELGLESKTCRLLERSIPLRSKFTSGFPLIFLHIEPTLKKDAVTLRGDFGDTTTSRFFAIQGL